ncbi:MAG: GNAT family protein [Breznakibacter sp.]
MTDLTAVTLRPWQKHDILALAQLADNYKIAQNLRDSFPSPYTIADAQKWVACNLEYPEPNPIRAIDYNGNLVGCAAAFLKDDVLRKNAEIGYWLGEQYWGKGIATVAVGLLVDYLFNNFDVHRVYAEVFGYNQASCRVLVKNRFVQEAVLRECIYKNGKFHDNLVFALRRGDWTLK